MVVNELELEPDVPVALLLAVSPVVLPAALPVAVPEPEAAAPLERRSRSRSVCDMLVVVSPEALPLAEPVPLALPLTVPAPLPEPLAVPDELALPPPAHADSARTIAAVRMLTDDLVMSVSF